MTNLVRCPVCLETEIIDEGERTKTFACGAALFKNSGEPIWDDLDAYCDRAYKIALALRDENEKLRDIKGDLEATISALEDNQNEVELRAENKRLKAELKRLKRNPADVNGQAATTFVDMGELTEAEREYLLTLYEKRSKEKQ